MNTAAARHQKATARAWKYGWVIYRGHAVFGAPGKGWTVKSEGEVMMDGQTLGECLRSIDAVVEGD